jgi:hypothetical protein
MNGDLPILRLQLTGMGAAITTAFATHAEQVSQEVALIVAKEIADFNFEAEVRNAVRPAMKRAVERALSDFFEWGEGKTMVSDAVRSAFKSKDV